MPAIIKLKNSQTSGNSPSLVAGETGINEADGNFFYRNSVANAVEKTNLRRIDPMIDDIIPYAIKAPVSLHGGGIVSYDGSNVNWSNRFVVISNGYSTRTAANGLFEIAAPPSGTTITGVGGASNSTTSSGGIAISGWQTLYYILPYGGSNTTVNANFRLASYVSPLVIPHTWIPICSFNFDTNTVNFNRFSLSAGDQYDTSRSFQSQISGRNSYNQGRDMFFRS